MKDCKECCYCIDKKAKTCVILKKPRNKNIKNCWAFADKEEFKRREEGVREYSKNFGEGKRGYRELNIKEI